MITRRSTLFWIQVAVLLGFVLFSIIVRGALLGSWRPINPDEAELMAQGRAALASPAPFSTWTLGTTGPFWPLFLALLGLLGAPLTLAFGHLLAAVIVGVMGFVLWLMLRRWLAVGPASILALLWFMPIALSFPVGIATDFGALSTEYLPALLLVIAAAIPLPLLVKRPWLFGVVGLLLVLAVGAKYQAAPVALGLVVAQFLLSKRSPRQLVRPVIALIVGALVPILLLALFMVVSGTVSLDLLAQNFSFLGSYAGGVSLDLRLFNSTRLLTHQPYLDVAVVVLAWLTYLSDRRVRVARIVIMVLAVSTVYAGGKGFGHYLILVYVAVAIALALPIRPDRTLIPNRRIGLAAVGVFGALSVTLFTVGGLTGDLRLTSPQTFAASVSPNSVLRTASLARACPPGSSVLVWGWAPELYVYYSWKNTVPFMNILGIATDPISREQGQAVVSAAVKRSDCVIDAVGKPFFAVLPGASITRVYPKLAAPLGADFRVDPDAVKCHSCTVWVRR